MNQPRAILILISLTMSHWLAAQMASAQNVAREWVKTAAAPLVESRIVEGLSIGYIEGDEFGIVHLGAANGAKRPANFRTLYEIGSITKVFTSLLLADAVVRGEIDLNAPAEVDNPAGIRLPSRDGRSIQWIDLSTHRSGLPRLAGNFQITNWQDPYHDYDSKRAAAFLNQYDLPRPPGESREYSNFGVSILGYLLAEKLGKSYEELLQEQIAEPLGMTDCTISPTADQRKRLATPHDRVGSPRPLWTFADLPGAGGIRTTMRDLMRFAKAQLNPPTGTLGEAIELAWREHRAADASGAAMGLGWMIAADVETRWHNGGTGGSSSAIFINRQHRCAVVILSNTSAPNQLEPLAMQLIAKAAGRETKADRGKRNGTPPKLSPFTNVQFEGDQVIVTYDGQAYEWLELDGIKVEDIVASSKKQFGGQWQKRFSEDLVELLWGMDQRPGNSVKLLLRDLSTQQDIVVERARLSEENRYAVKANREQAGGAATVERGNDKLVVDAKLRGRLVGRYQLTPNFIFDVQDRDGRLMVGITNQPTQEVSPDSPTRWTYPARHATLEFILPEVGAAGSLVLHQDGAEQTAYRIGPGDDEDVDDDADKLPIDASLRRRLTGRYQLAPNFIFTVRDRDGHLMVSATDQPTQEVFPDSPTRWSCRGIDATLEFKLPKTGRARSLVLHQNGMEQTARRMK